MQQTTVARSAWKWDIGPMTVLGPGSKYYFQRVLLQCWVFAHVISLSRDITGIIRGHSPLQKHFLFAGMCNVTAELQLWRGKLKLWRKMQRKQRRTTRHQVVLSLSRKLLIFALFRFKQQWLQQWFRLRQQQQFRWWWWGRGWEKGREEEEKEEGVTAWVPVLHAQLCSNMGKQESNRAK